MLCLVCHCFIFYVLLVDREREREIAAAMSSSVSLHRSSSKEGKKKERVTFDEVTIAEHDKLRGTRQKIDEPDTPFERTVKEVEEDDGGGNDEGSEGVIHGGVLKLGDLEKKLEVAAAAAAAGDASAIPSASNFSRKADFSEKRKHHYNEFLALKKWKETHPDGEDADDE